MNTESIAACVLGLLTLEAGRLPLMSSVEGNYFMREYNALSAVVGLSNPGYMIYGPYASLAKSDYTVEYILRSPPTVMSMDSVIATLDVYDGEVVFAVADVTATNFLSVGANEWVKVYLHFTVTTAEEGHKFEFRFYWSGAVNVDLCLVRAYESVV